MSSSEIIAGKAVVEVGTRLAIKRGLQQAEAHFKNFGAKVGQLSQSVAIASGVAVAGAAAAFAPLFSAAKQFADLGGALDDMSQRTGASVEALSALGFAAKQSGTNLEAVEGGIKRTQLAIVQAMNGNQQLAATFNSLGLSLTQLAAMSPTEQFTTLAQAIGGIQDPTQRAAMAMQLFGKSGTELLPLMRGDIRALTNEAKSLGLVMSGESAEAAAALGDAFDKVSDVLGGLWTKIGEALAPALTHLLNKTVEVVTAVNHWVSANRQVVVFIAGVTAAVGIAGIALGGLAVAGGVTSFALTSLATVCGLASTAYGFLATMITAASGATTVFGAISAAVLSPIYAVVGVVGAVAIAVVALVAAWAGVGAYIAYEAGLMGEAFTWLQSKFWELFGTAKTTLSGVVAALSAGEFSLAAKILWAGVKLAFFQGADAALEAIEKLAMNAFSIFNRMNMKIAELLYKLGSQIPSLLTAGFTGGSFQQAMTQLIASGFNLDGILNDEVSKAQRELDSLTSQLPKQAPEQTRNDTTGAGVDLPKLLEQQRQQLQKLDEQMLLDGPKLATQTPNQAPQQDTLESLRRDREAHETRSYASGQAFDAAEAELRRRELAFRQRQMNEAARARQAVSVAQSMPNPKLPETPEVKALELAPVAASQQMAKTSAVSTFSAAAVGAIAAGTGDDRVANNTASLVGLTRRMLRQRQRGPAYS